MQDLNSSQSLEEEKMQEKLMTLESDNLELNNKIQKLELDLNIKTMESQNCQTLIQNLEKELKESKSIEEYTKIYNQCSKLSAECQEYVYRIKEKEKELMNLQEQSTCHGNQITLKDNEIELYKSQFTQEQDKVKKMHSEMETLNQDSIHHTLLLNEKEQQNQYLQNQISKLTREIQECQQKNSKDSLLVKELHVLNFTLEKSLASMDLKEKQSLIKMKSQSEEIESLTSQVQALLSQDHSKEIISNLSKENSIIKESKLALQEELDDLKQIQVQQSLEIEKAQQLLLLEISTHSQTKESRLEYQNKLQETILSIEFYSSKIEQLESQLTTSNNRIQSLKQCLKLENETVKSFDCKLKTQQDAFSQLQLSLDSMKNQLRNETLEKNGIKDKLEILEKTNQEYKIKMETLENSSYSIQSQKDIQIKENDILKQRMNIIMKQYDSLLSEKQSLALVNKQEMDDLQSKYHQELSKRANLENIKATMTRLVKELEEAAKKETEKRQSLEHLLEMSQQKMDYLESQLNLTSKTSQDSCSSETAIPKKSQENYASHSRRVKPLDYSPDRQSLILTPRKSIRSSLMNIFKG